MDTQIERQSRRSNDRQTDRQADGKWGQIGVPNQIEI